MLPRVLRYQTFRHRTVPPPARDGADIDGATSTTYALTQADGAALVACRVRATNDAGDSVPATSGPVRVAQEGGADVSLNGPVKVSANRDGTYTVDTGITVSCPPRLPKNCGGSNQVTASASTDAGRAAAALTVARSGFAAKSGAKLKVVMKLTRCGSKLLRRTRQLRLVAVVTTRNHALQRVTSRKQLTVKAPR